MGALVPATYKYYKAPNKAAALRFLYNQTISKKIFIIAVETPEGRWIKDIDGTFAA